MPCFLNEIDGSKSRLRASALRPGPESWTSTTASASRRAVVAEHRAAVAGGLGGILQQVGQDALHLVGVRPGGRRVVWRDSRS